MFSKCLFYSFRVCRNLHLQGVCKSLYRVTEAPAAMVSSQALPPARDNARIKVHHGQGMEGLQGLLLGGSSYPLLQGGVQSSPGPSSSIPRSPHSPATNGF